MNREENYRRQRRIAACTARRMIAGGSVRRLGRGRRCCRYMPERHAHGGAMAAASAKLISTLRSSLISYTAAAPSSFCVIAIAARLKWAQQAYRTAYYRWPSGLYATASTSGIRTRTVRNDFQQTYLADHIASAHHSRRQRHIVAQRTVSRAACLQRHGDHGSRGWWADHWNGQ